MNRSGSLYIEKDSIIHRLDGSIKLIMLLAWTIFVFMFMDLRIFTVMLIMGFLLIQVAKIPFKSIKPLILFVVIFTIFNTLFLLIITPEFGSELTGTYSIIVEIFGRQLTYETVFYAITLSLKYLSILPITILFVFTTHPSRFASSLNRIGISYRVAYAVNIALRYIPDVTEETRNIINAQESRGVSFNKKETNVFTRLKNYTTILIPLLISSLNRVDIVSNAMDLRGFGRFKQRTWYNREKLRLIDFLVLGSCLLLIGLGIWLDQQIAIEFWYPF